MRITRLVPLLASAALLAGCRDHSTFVGGGRQPDPPTDLVATQHWVLEGFTAAGQPSGYPVADLSWNPPASWSDEVFRVYGRRSGSGQWFLIATVTSCTSTGCTYRDRNVSAGQSYDYYVATTVESSDQEASTASTETVSIPAASAPAAPLADSAVALDNAAFLRWRDNGNGARLWKYVVYLTRIDGTSYLYGLGESDGTSFLDGRATNGHVYGYRIAAVDTTEQVSALSPEITVAPRPDAHSELIYSFSSNAAESGFRFQTSEATTPILAGSATSAQWRLEQDASGWRIVPLNGTQVVQFGFTNALTCGPGSDAGCVAVTRAPAAGYSSAPIAVNSEFSYVFRVTGSDGQPHYGVVRADILGSDGTGRQLMIFDWSYQLIANEPRLDRSGR
jgi:hypothetical protein